MHGGRGKCLCMHCVLAKATDMLCSTAKALTCTMVGCYSIKSHVVGETSKVMRSGAGGGGAMSRRMPYGGAKTGTMPLCRACRVVAHNHAKCPKGGQCAPTSSMVGQKSAYMHCGGARFAHMHSAGENSANKPYAGEKSAKMTCHRANFAHMRYGGSKSSAMRSSVADSAHMHCGGGKCSRMPCVMAKSTSMLCGTAKAPHALCTMHCGGMKFDYMPCGGGNVQVHVEWGRRGAKSGRMPYGGAKTATMPLCGACRVMAQNHAKCPTVGQGKPTSSVVAQNPPACIVVGQG